MKNPLLKSLAFLAVTGFVGSQSANAGILATYNQAGPDLPDSVTIGSTAFDGDITNTNDLIASSSSTLTSFTASSPGSSGFASLAGTNDGQGGNNLAGSADYLEGDSFATPPGEVFTFVLNTGAGGSVNGYNITKIQSIAGWNNANDGSQDFSVSYESKSSPSTWIPLTVGNSDGGLFFNSIVSDGENDGTETLLTNSGGGIFLSNVTALQFTYVDPSTSNSTILHELDVFGSAAPASVPEPSTWALMFAGLGVLLFVNRSRRKLNV